MAVPEEIQEKMLEEATSATPNYGTDYSDERFGKVESDYNQDLTELEQTYGGMIGNTDQFYDKQIQASKDWADKQSQIQQENTDFAIEKIEQQKNQAHKDYLKEQSGAYVDWQKQSNQYGVNAEKTAAAGLDKSGYSESSQVSMYNTYQNRVSTARETYSRAVLNYDNAIKDAQLQNNAALAEIAYNSLQKQLELGLQGFQYKNQLILDLTAEKRALKSEKWQKEQAIIEQQNWEKQMAEQRWQYEDNKAWQTEESQKQRDWQEKQNEIDRQHQEKLKEIQHNYDVKMAAIDQEYKLKYLDAQTKKEKELIDKQLAADKAKLEKQKQIEIEMLEYEQKLNKTQINGGGSPIYKSSSGGSLTSEVLSPYVKINNTSSSNKSKTANALYNGAAIVGAMVPYPSNIDLSSVLNLGYGPLAYSELKKLENQGKVEPYTSGGKIAYRKVK